MKSDFSRVSFDPRQHFSRVLQQQGRVTLDADANEQTSILLHYLQTLARDLIGPHAAPREGGGFLLANDGKGGITISPGRYYVDGILIENDELCNYAQQPDYTPGEDDALLQEQNLMSGKQVWLYLDVWERHISALENDAIREKALGGIDTCHRSKVVWQVRAKSSADIPGNAEQDARRQKLLAQKTILEKKLKDLGASIPPSTHNGLAVSDVHEVLSRTDAAVLSVPLATPAPVLTLLPTFAPTTAAGTSGPSTTPTPTATPQPTFTPTPSVTPTPTPQPTQTPNNQIGQLLLELEKINNELEQLESERASLCQLGMASLSAISDAALRARIDPGPQNSGPCIIAPDAKYRGAENHLYRVEIHQGGNAGRATFKWSRENGSVATAWLGTEGMDLLVGSSRGFAAGDWVELSFDELDLNGSAGNLFRLTKVEAGVLTVDGNNLNGGSLTWDAKMGHPKVRRWDQQENDAQTLRDGAVPIQESPEGKDIWLNLEDGVQIGFRADGQYRAGDYWLIPARVGLDTIDNWPYDLNDAKPVPLFMNPGLNAAKSVPLFMNPQGVQHHYAPLGVAQWNDGSWEEDQLQSCYCQFDQLARCPDDQVT